MTASSARYTPTAVVLHWLIAVLIVINVSLTWAVDSVPDTWVRPFIDTHKSIGITVLGLAVMRLLWRSAHPPPPLPSAYSRRVQRIAHVAHWLLYALMIALPLSGWMHDSAWKDAASHPMRWFDLFPWPRIGWIMGIEPQRKEVLHTWFGQIHASLGYVLYGLFVLHVGAALKHQYVDKAPELQRMKL